MRSGNHYAPLFAVATGIPPDGGRLRSGPNARPRRQAPRVRHRQGRRRQVDGRDRARDRGVAARAAHARRGAQRPGARRRDVRRAGGARRGGRARRGRPPRDLGRHGGGARGVPARARRPGRRPAVRLARVPHARRGDAGDARAADGRQGVGAVAGSAPHQRRRQPPVRPRDRRRPRDRPRARRAALPRDVRGDRARRADREPGPHDRRGAARTRRTRPCWRSRWRRRCR